MQRSHLSALLKVTAFVAVAAAALLWLLPSATHSPPAAAQETVNVDVGDRWFCNSSFEGAVCETTISAGETVSWDFSRASLPHTSTECGDDCDGPTNSPLWDSGFVSDGSTFEFTFDQVGTFLYYCRVHPRQMRGRIIVHAAEPGLTPTPTMAATPIPTPSPTIASPPADTATPTSRSGPVGDVGCDGTVDSLDAALVLQFDAGLIDSLACSENADTNGDGVVNSIDASLILQFDAGLIGALRG